MQSLEELLAAIQNGGKGSMDLGILANSYVQYAAEGGLLQPLDMSLIPNIERMFPDFRKMESLHYEGKPYAVPFAWGSLPLMYNADVIKEAPTSWWELFNPAYKGKAAIVEDIGGTFQIFSIMANGTKTPWNNTKEMLDKTVDLLIKFKKEQALTICASYGDLAALLGSGEVVIAQSWEPVSQWTGENSPTIKWSYPKEGYPNFVDSYLIVAEAPNLEWDHKILNHVLSAEAQAANAEKNATAVVNQDSVPMLSEAARKLYPYDDIQSFFEKAGGFGQMFPFKEGSEYESYDHILEGWERFLKA
jgi:putative spermidine/putrescine transport system substrate-binding protein/spermidine/putrescine transport system substrate-binding protein